MASGAGKSFYKCIIWFQDGNVRTFYSPRSRRLPPPEGSQDPGFKRLVRLITIRFQGTWRAAAIYENTAKGAELAAFYEGKRIR
jgi:hypothetical protein